MKDYCIIITKLKKSVLINRFWLIRFFFDFSESYLTLRAIVIAIINEKNEILLQQRSPNKDKNTNLIE